MAQKMRTESTNEQIERPWRSHLPNFGRGYILIALVTVGVMLSNAVLLFVGTRKVFDYAHEVAHSHEVLAASENLLSTLADAETGQRGYIITGVPIYLEPFETAKRRVHGSVDRLRTLAYENLEHKPAIYEIERLVDDKLAELSETIALRREKGFEAARKIMVTDRGKRVMDTIRSRLKEINSRESTILASSEQKSQSNYELVLLANALSLFLGLGILSFAYFIVYQDIVIRRRADEALRESEARLREFSIGLEHRVTARTAELVQSRDRLRAMATELNLAEQRERQRLARELHDHLQQLLVLGKIKLGHGKQLADQVPACAILLRETDEVLSEALTYTRTLVADLSPRVLSDHGLAAGLIWLREYMQKHSMTVTVRAPEEDVVLPEDQKILLFQSVRELLINASKHARTDQATVTLEQLNGELRIEVRDEGVGFDHAETTIPSNGELSSKFGLLSIRERMQVLGGFFDIQSVRGIGTTATLVMPVARQADNGLSLKVVGTRDNFTTPTAFPTQLSSTKVRVLLVDDHVMLRQGLRAVLETYPDVEVIGEAGNGEEAVTLAAQLRPSAVLMDINMPGMNGIEATKAIMLQQPEAIIVGLSVNATETSQEAMSRAGALELFTKEVAIERIYEAIQKAMRKKEAMEHTVKPTDATKSP